jgi:hypothetical protein
LAVECHLERAQQGERQPRHRRPPSFGCLKEFT